MSVKTRTKDADCRRQLYRRVAFNIAIGNSDDHFRYPIGFRLWVKEGTRIVKKILFQKVCLS